MSRTRSIRSGPPRLARRANGDDGSETAELVLVVPAMFLTIAFALQFTLWAFASHAVLAAASVGGDVARARGSSIAAGEAAASAALGPLAGGIVLGPSVTARVTTGGDDVLVVGGDVVSLFPGLHLRVGAVSIGPPQEFRGSG